MTTAPINGLLLIFKFIFISVGLIMKSIDLIMKSVALIMKPIEINIQYGLPIVIDPPPPIVATNCALASPNCQTPILISLHGTN